MIHRARRAAPMVLTALLIVLAVAAWAYPPALGILSKAKSCNACHVSNGPWTDESKTIVDILDKETGKSLKQPDGTFLIEAKRFEPKPLLTVIGRVKDDLAVTPYRNAWLYIDLTQIDTTSLAKFAPGWSVDLPAACRLVGDKAPGYDGARITALPMTIRPLDSARDATLELHLMLTAGESVKGDATKGMVGNYVVRTVRLVVKE